ncbi:hypothetical protein CROQUDRAFT_96880 [Cronartium quercuum f. sp. fusiforme G11]|uniref:Uncharacterized protein n=1 Tax=Cronartium quercuum f. sp. fusiforme G11 TaxID=708437 RepID=A0A9P6NAG9_9BASI|nr:hypothetical protein CROQUDRAFT_96880 [Cronartium quercuum f. sp. fusiforme G11]
MPLGTENVTPRQVFPSWMTSLAARLAALRRPASTLCSPATGLRATDSEPPPAQSPNFPLTPLINLFGPKTKKLSVILIHMSMSSDYLFTLSNPG